MRPDELAVMVIFALGVAGFAFVWFATEPYWKAKRAQGRLSSRVADTASRDTAPPSAD